MLIARRAWRPLRRCQPHRVHSVRSRAMAPPPAAPSAAAAEDLKQQQQPLLAPYADAADAERAAEAAAL